MADTHILNRECDKATIHLAEQKNQLQLVSTRLNTLSNSARAALEAKVNVKQSIDSAELRLKEATSEASNSEKKLAERIEGSKLSISTFFSLKKELNSKEWELSKAKSNLEQLICTQREMLTGLESQNLATHVQLDAETLEVRCLQLFLKNSMSHLLILHSAK